MPSTTESAAGLPGHSLLTCPSTFMRFTVAGHLKLVTAWHNEEEL